MTIPEENRLSEETLNFLKGNIKDPVELAVILTALEEDLDPSTTPPDWEEYTDSVMAGGGIGGYRDWKKSFSQSEPTVLSLEPTPYGFAGPITPVEEMIRGALQGIEQFRKENPQISPEQWDLIVPVIKKQIRTKTPAMYTLNYSETAHLKDRIELGHGFHRAGETKGGAGVFTCVDAGCLYLEIVRHIIEE